MFILTCYVWLEAYIRHTSLNRYGHGYRLPLHLCTLLRTAALGISQIPSTIPIMDAGRLFPVPHTTDAQVSCRVAPNFFNASLTPSSPYCSRTAVFPSGSLRVRSLPSRGTVILGGRKNIGSGTDN